MERKNYSLINLLFCGLVVFDIVLNLIPTYKGSFITDYMEIEGFRALSLRVSNAINTIVFGVIILLSGIINKSKYSLVLSLTVLMVFSAIVNLRLDSSLQIIGFFFIGVGLFCTEGYRIKESFIKIVSLFVILWAVLPVLYYPFASPEQVLYMFGSDNEATRSTFCGFGFHRNDYGFYAGLSVLLLLIVNYPKWFKLLALIVIPIGLFMCQSRSSLFGVMIAAFVYKWKDIPRNRRVLLIVLSAAVFLLLVYFSNIEETRFFSESYGRENINTLSWKLFLGSPIVGYGGATMVFSSDFPEGSPCHNFILQSAVDYGPLPSILFCILLYRVYCSSTKDAKAILLFLCIIGFFQPYLTLGLPKMYSLIAFLYVVMFNHLVSGRKQTSSIDSFRYEG